MGLGIRSRIGEHPVATFFLVTYFLSWTAWVPLVFSDRWATWSPLVLVAIYGSERLAGVESPTHPSGSQ